MNLLESLPFDEPEEPNVEEVEVIEEQIIQTKEKSRDASNVQTDSDDDEKTDGEGQITLF